MEKVQVEVTGKVLDHVVKVYGDGEQEEQKKGLVVEIENDTISLRPFGLSVEQLAETLSALHTMLEGILEQAKEMANEDTGV